jgi:ribonucleoside-diphosphate reductase alpha chain
MIDLINVNDDPETNHTNYQYVAGKQRLRMLRKDVYGQYEPPRLYDIVKRNVEAGVYTPSFSNGTPKTTGTRWTAFIDHEKDEKYSYSALEQLITKYLVRNRVTDVIYETPQVRYMIAAAVCFHKEGKNGKRLGYVRDYYEAASTGAFTLATPVLAGLGTKTKQFSSCVLISVRRHAEVDLRDRRDDGRLRSKRAGIGSSLAACAAIGAPIRGGEIKHTGIIPFLKKWFGDLRSARRAASATRRPR